MIEHLRNFFMIQISRVEEKCKNKILNNIYIFSENLNFKKIQIFMLIRCTKIHVNFFNRNLFALVYELKEGYVEVVLSDLSQVVLCSFENLCLQDITYLFYFSFIFLFLKFFRWCKERNTLTVKYSLFKFCMTLPFCRRDCSFRGKSNGFLNCKDGERQFQSEIKSWRTECVGRRNPGTPEGCVRQLGKLEWRCIDVEVS